MKTQLSKPSCSKARYTDQYKQEALELWRAIGRSAAKGKPNLTLSVLPTGRIIFVADSIATNA